MFKVTLDYKILITLIWCVESFCIIVVHDFQFKNGSSLVFLTLILVFALFTSSLCDCEKKNKEIKKRSSSVLFWSDTI